jgi:hypothetical protein
VTDLSIGSSLIRGIPPAGKGQASPEVKPLNACLPDDRSAAFRRRGRRG